MDLKNIPEYAWKWQAFEKDILPLWVADMDYIPPKEVREAVLDYSKSAYFGYGLLNNEIYETIQSWVEKYYGFTVNQEEIVLSAGVISAMEAYMAAYMNSGDNFITFTPVYPPFLRLTACRDIEVKEVALKNLGNHYEIDWNLLEASIDIRTKFIVLSNPHNPSGNIWTREELSKILKLAEKYDLRICSDEIWADFIFDDADFNSFYSLGEKTYKRVACFFAPSKTFNIAGLNFSYSIIKDKQVRENMKKVNKAMFSNTNIIGVQATIAAYKYGEKWFEEVKNKIRTNYYLVKDFFKKNYKNLIVFPTNSTYLLWIDCSALGEKNVYKYFLEKAKLAFRSAHDFGSGNEQFIRINLSCEKETILEALKRIRENI